MEPEQVWRAGSGTQPPLTDDLVDATERELGVHLPESLVTLLRYQNGGSLQVGFPMDGDYNIDHYTIRGIGPEWERIEKGAWWHRDPDFPGRPDEAEWVVPFDGDGHWDLCLDYRDCPTDPTGLRTGPAIVVIDNECESETFVAASFDDYLAQLVPEEDEE